MAAIGFAAALMGSTAANASILVDQGSAYGDYYVGGSGWANFTADLAGEVGGYVLGSIANGADVAGATAILVNERFYSQGMTAAETANLSAFLATGGRVVIFGENSGWTDWDNVLLAFASGGTASFGGEANGSTNAIVSNSLTNGVSSLNLVAAGVSTGGSGTQLFADNVAALWGAQQNLLTILDINAVDNSFGNVQFSQNVADWLGSGQSGSAVPEPATWAMMIAGFGLAGAAIRKRRAAQVAA